MTKRILIVDDEESLAYFLSEHLSAAELGFEVDIAHSASQAAIKIKQQAPDLIITDLRMPGVDGLQLLTWVRAVFPDTRVVLMTAYGSDEVETEARRLQVYRYITKPFQIQDIVAVAQSALGEIALSEQGILVLSDESFGAITVALEALRVDVGARCVLMADSMGQLITRAGVVHSLDLNLLLALLSNTFLASLEVARQVHAARPAGFNYLECEEMNVYTVMVDQELFLTLLFDKGAEASRVGTVWFYAQRVVERLIQMLKISSRQPQERQAALDVGFGESLTAELENMLGELQAETEPAGDDQEPRMPFGLDDQPSLPSLDEGSRSPWLPDDDKLAAGEPQLLDIEAAIARGLINESAADLLRGGRKIG